MSDKEADHLLDNISKEIDGTKERKCSKCQQPCRGHIGPYGPSCTAIIHVPQIHAKSQVQAQGAPTTVESENRTHSIIITTDNSNGYIEH